MAGTPYVGKNSRIQVDGINLNLAQWRATERATEIDTYNFESGGYGEQTHGKQFIEFSASGFFDSGQYPSADPPNITASSQVTGVKLYLNTTDDVYISIPIADIFSCTTTAEADSTVKFEFSGKSNGTYTLPT